MALTNDQITAQNFKDFYSEIRPYLNGNSPLAVNTFNKSDLYDTTEKIVGRWIDGRPLYQKTCVTTVPTTTVDGTYVQVALDNDTTHKLVSGYGFFVQTNNAIRAIPNLNLAVLSGVNAGLVTQVKVIQDENSTINLGNNFAGWSGYQAYVTIQYLKVNDIQMSISDGNEYSTDEQLVGHWIDGKPLYQKTIVQNLTLPINSAQVNFGDISDLHIDYGTVVELAFNEDGYWVNQSDVAIWLRKPNNNFGGRSTLTNVARTGTAYITIRYTKTTD